MTKELLTKEELLEWIDMQLNWKPKYLASDWWQGYDKGWNNALQEIKEKYFDQESNKETTSSQKEES